MSELWDAPNQQVVRADESAPWDEGTGGEPGEPGEPGGEPGAGEDIAGPAGLDAMTKAELIEKAQSMGVSPANNDMTKAELIAGIEAAGG